MKNIKKILGLLLMTFLVSHAMAQQEAMENQYMFNGLFLNPAFAGSRPHSTATLLYRKQWVGFNGAPVSQFLCTDGSLNNEKVGLGFTLLNDQIGVSRRMEFYGNYAYHLKLSTGKLAMGLRGGMAYYRANLSDLTVWDNGDQVFNSDISSKLLPNFGTGLYYYMDKFYAGVSVPNIVSYKEDNFLYEIGNRPRFQRHYYLTSGYIYKLNGDVSLKPSFLLKYTSQAPMQADFNLNVLLKDVVSIGASYRTGDSFIGILGFNATKRLNIGYAYDYPVTPVRIYSSGSHEININYYFGKQSKNISTSSFF